MSHLSGMAGNTTAGFREPAKRSAFGDVTNVSKHVHSRDENKVLKVHGTNSSSTALSALPLNKENVVYASKDAFNRPAQRHAGVSVASKASEQPRKAVRRDSHQENRVSYVRKDVQAKAPNSLSSTSNDARPLQPRHHKSQPQLKQNQPTLRRTQSKQLETVVAPEEETEPLEEEAAAAMALQEVTDAQTSAAYFDALYMSAAQEAVAEAEREEQSVELGDKLAEISEEEAVVPVGYQEAHLRAMSEPEEWDEEDDEDFDDQDQAYTTAHSFRSRDLTAGGATTVVPPRVTARVQRELEEAKLEVERTRPPDDIEEEMWDVSMVAEYGDEIFEYMRELEVRNLHMVVHEGSTNCRIGQDAPQPPLHGHPDGDPVVNAIGSHGLAGSGAQPIRPPARDSVLDRQLHRPILVVQGCLHRKAAACRRHSNPRRLQVRRD